MSYSARAIFRQRRKLRRDFAQQLVIAAINGVAIDVGSVLALCCDVLIATDEAFLAMTEVMSALPAA